jgi:predicted GNAT family N-acyltransferase
MLTTRLALTRQDFGWCIVIRTLVFVVEQGISPGLEIDAGEDTSRHWLGLEDGVTVATVRWRLYEPGVAKIERVAVLKPWRGQKIATILIGAVEADIATKMPGARTLRLDAQDTAIPFYERLGYRASGDGFLDAELPHHTMLKYAVD